MPTVAYHDVHLPMSVFGTFSPAGYTDGFWHNGPMTVVTKFSDSMATAEAEFQFLGDANNDINILVGETVGARRALYLFVKLNAAATSLFPGRGPTVAGYSYSSSPPVFHMKLSRVGEPPQVFASDHEEGVLTVETHTGQFDRYLRLEGSLVSNAVNTALAANLIERFQFQRDDVVELRWDFEGTNPFIVPDTTVPPGDDTDVVGIPVPAYLFGPWKKPEEDPERREYGANLARNLDLIGALTVLGVGWAVNEVNTAFGNLWAGDPLADELSALPVISIGDAAVALPRAIAIGVDFLITDYEAGIAPPLMSYVDGAAKRADDFLATLGDSRAVGEFIGWAALLSAFLGPGAVKGLGKLKYVGPLVGAAALFTRPQVKKLKEYLLSEPEDRRKTILDDAMKYGADIEDELAHGLEDLHSYGIDQGVTSGVLENVMKPPLDLLFGKGFALRYLEASNTLRASAALVYSRGSHAAEHAAIREHLTEAASDDKGSDV